MPSIKIKNETGSLHPKDISAGTQKSSENLTNDQASNNDVQTRVKRKPEEKVKGKKKGRYFDIMIQLSNQFISCAEFAIYTV